MIPLILSLAGLLCTTCSWSLPREIARVLKSGGKGAFQEPLGHNRLLEFARAYLPYKKHPVKGTDRPLFMADVERFGRHFGTWSYRGFGLKAGDGRQDTAPTSQFFAAPRIVSVRRILVRQGALRPALCRIFVICVTK